MEASGPQSARSAIVSVVVIAYNEHDHIEGCLRALLSQDAATPFRLIVVDDGSTDDTAELARRAAGEDPRVQIVQLPENRGRGAARAAGVAEAVGHAIGFVDADVTVPPNWLEACLAALPGNAAVSGIAVPDGHTAVLARITGAKPRPVGGSMAISGSNVLFDRTVFGEFGFDPRDRIGEDTRLAARLIRAGHGIHRVPGLVVRHDESKSYARELRWRYLNGVDAASLPRLLGVRFADAVWLGWLVAWLLGIGGALAWSPWWLLLGIAATVAAGFLHAASRFERRPLGAFVGAGLANVPLLGAYFLGRTVGLPRLVVGRP